MLARLLRSGNLTPVRVPDEEQEAMRDLVRFREDCTISPPYTGSLVTLEVQIRYKNLTKGR